MKDIPVATPNGLMILFLCFRVAPKTQFIGFNSCKGNQQIAYYSERFSINTWADSQRINFI
jgi:hypothetical protein